MKRDMDLTRAILLEIEKLSANTEPGEFAIEGWKPEEVQYHIRLLHQADLIEVINTSENGDDHWAPRSLTWQGHENLGELLPGTMVNKADLERRYEKAYFFEFERKEKINSRINFVVTNILMIIGWSSFYLKNAPKFSDILNFILFYLPLFIVFLVLIRVLQLVYSYLFGLDYKYASSLDGVGGYLGGLDDFNRESDSKVDVEEKLSEMFICHYQEAATKNYENNHQKQKLLITIQKLLFAAVVALFLSGIPFLILSR